MFFLEFNGLYKNNVPEKEVRFCIFCWSHRLLNIRLFLSLNFLPSVWWPCWKLVWLRVCTTVRFVVGIWTPFCVQLNVAKLCCYFFFISECVQESGKDSQEKKKNHIKALPVAATECEPLSNSFASGWNFNSLLKCSGGLTSPC